METLPTPPADTATSDTTTSDTTPPDTTPPTSAPTRRARSRVPAVLRVPLAWDAAVTMIFLLAIPMPAVTFFADPATYVPLHIVLEFVSMAISLMVFSLAWNLRRPPDNSRTMLLGAASLAIGLLDLGHVLSYAGMPAVVTPSGAHKAIVFWLAARAVGAVVFVAIALMRPRSWPARAWYPIVAGTVVVTAAVCWIGFVHPDQVPAMFVPGQGLTRLKVGSEYAISALYALAAVLLFRRARREGSPDTAWLAAAAWVLVLAELLFTLYASVTDVFNLLGHVFKVVAYIMVYRAVFVTGVQEPYRQLARQRSLLGSLIDSMPDLILFKDRDSRYIGANTSFLTFAGIESSDLVGRRDEELLPGRIPAPGEGDPAIDRAVIEQGAVIRREAWVTTAEGDGHCFDTVKTPYLGPDGESLGLIGVSRDITEQKAAEQRIQYLASYDQLTGLPNRILLADRVDDQIRAADAGSTLALLLLDVDDFHAINDSLGHQIGDALLVRLAERLVEEAGEAATVARLGGDEFLVLLPRTAAAGATEVARRFRERANESFVIDDCEIIVTASVGVALFPDHATTFDGLLRGADTAASLAKADRRNSTRFYDTDLQDRSAERLNLLASLRRAVDENQLVLHYQPQMSLRDGRICGVEALLRWQHPDHGLLAPARFIDLAEDSGLIVPIGEWVVQRAVTDMQEWVSAGLGLQTVAVNVSAEQVHLTDVAAQVQRALDRSGLAAPMLEVELTESIALHDAEAAVAVMGRLHDLGVRVAIDDFGTGYSSLDYLRRFRVDRLKIDRSFVSDIGTDSPQGSAIVGAVIGLAGALGCGTVAEGIEQEEQLAFVRDRGCDVGQGYLIARPMPAESIRALLSG